MRLPLLLLWLFSAANSLAQPAPLFAADTVLSAKLTGPLQATVRAKHARTEAPFLLQVGEELHAVKLRPRGNSRLRVCSFPPLRLNFDKGETAGSLFAGQDKLKLVTHCKRGAAAQANLLQEYAAYRILNLITPVSFRVRLLQLTYHDDTRPNEGQTHFAFLIESQDALAERLHGEIAAAKAISRRQLDPQHAARVFVFQYLIGNTDWSMVTPEGQDTCCHNAGLVGTGEALQYVPYDFDLAGLVNANYAYPAPELRIRKVTQRLYRGLCLPDPVLRQAVEEVTAKRQQTLHLIDTLPGLSSNEAVRTAKYLQGFYQQAQDVDTLIALFAKSCL